MHKKVEQTRRNTSVFRNQSVGRLQLGPQKHPDGNKKYRNVESPTRKLIEQHEDRLGKFDINRIWRWNTNNIKKYKTFVKNEARIENKDVIFNLMLCDKQIQDLQDNHKIIKEMRGKQMHFTELVQSLKVAPSGPASLSDGSKRSSLERPAEPDSGVLKSHAESEEEDSWDSKSLKQQRVAKGKSNAPNHKTR